MTVHFEIISFVMSKAFNRVPHNIFIQMLSQYGFHGNIEAWFRNFLKNRSQFVKLISSTSDEIPVTSGIIQGSLAVNCIVIVL